MKPLISYYGGKQRIASRIVQHLQAIPHTVYAEPFAGGLAVLFTKPVPAVGNNNYYREAINDSLEMLINLYRVAREQPEEFERIITLTPYSRSEYARAIAICRDPESHNPMDKAWAYYVNIQQSFSHKLNAGWRTAVCTRNEAATWHEKRQRIPQCLERLQKVHIDCCDALEFIDRWDSPQTLFYCDPPYPNTEQGHYDGYTMADWESLCSKLDSIQGSYVLSNYPQPIEPQFTQQRIELSATCSASGQGKIGKGRDKSKAATAEALGDRARTEVLWVCDRSAGIRSDLGKALARRQQLDLFATTEL